MIGIELKETDNARLNPHILVWGLISCALIASPPIASQPLTQQPVLQLERQNVMPENGSDKRSDKTNDSTQSWLLLYPQHPLYRQTVEQQSQPNRLESNPIGNAPPVASPNNQVVKPANLSPTPKVIATPTIKTEPDPQSVKAETQASTTNPPPLFIQPVEPPDPALQPKPPKYFPSFNAGSPSGFGANWGDLFAGISLINRSSPVGSATDKADGSIAIGAGLGNAQELLGLEVVYNLISLTPSRFASNGSFDFKVHRVLPELMSVAVGWENAINYGPEAGGTSSTVYGAFSKFFVLQPDNIENPMLLGFTIGTGGGRFRSFNDQLEGRGGVGVFASAGLQVLSNLSVITDWTGQNLNLGVSYIPFANLPLYLNGTIVDAVGSTSFGARYSLGVGFGFNFR